MKYYLGVDGGGTKTKFVLCDAEGHVTAEAVGPTCHYLQGGFDGVTRVLSEGLSAVCAAQNIGPDSIVRAFVGCPGFGDVPGNVPIITAAIDAALSPIPYGVGNDCENALAGALGGQSGINLIAGTGSMGCGKNDAGTLLRCGGWHHVILSDEGSGYYIGVHILHEFTLQSDGRHEKTPLYAAVKEALSLTDDGEIIKRVTEDWAMDRTHIAAVSRLAGPLCRQKDPWVLDLLRESAQHLFEIAQALYRRLGFTGEIPVGYTGGVFQLGEPILAPLGKLLETAGMRLTPPLLTPDRGSLLLALRGGGVTITPRVLQNLKSARR